MRTLLLSLVSGFIAASSMQLACADDMQILKDLPPVSASTYRADRMVRAVNHLRSLGKDEAIRTLKSYAAQTDTREHEKVFLICRCLFDNRQGWKQPQLGDPVPSVVASVASQFPLFPLAITNGVPFLLVTGYRLDGRPESIADCIRLCERLPLIAKDLSETNHMEAALQLVTSKAFKELYAKVGDGEEIAKLVKRQAEPAKPPKSK